MRAEVGSKKLGIMRRIWEAEYGVIPGLSQNQHAILGLMIDFLLFFLTSQLRTSESCNLDES